MNPSIDKIHDTINEIINDWQLICNDHTLLDQGDFLEKMHTHILRLDEYSTHLKQHKHIHNLIHHILHTPIGAPIVFEKTLFDCAKEFIVSESKNSELLHYLEKSLHASNADDNFLFNSLSILNEKLEQAA